MKRWSRKAKGKNCKPGSDGGLTQAQNEVRSLGDGQEAVIKTNHVERRAVQRLHADVQPTSPSVISSFASPVPEASLQVHSHKPLEEFFTDRSPAEAFVRSPLTRSLPRHGEMSLYTVRSPGKGHDHSHIMTSPAHSTQSERACHSGHQPGGPLMRRSSLEKCNAPVPLPRQRGKSLHHVPGLGQTVQPNTEDILQALLRRKSHSSSVSTPAIAQRRDPQTTEESLKKGPPSPPKRRTKSESSSQEERITLHSELSPHHQQPLNGILKRDTSQRTAIVVEQQFVSGQESGYCHQIASPPQPSGSAWSVSTSDSSLASLDSRRSSSASRSSRSSESSLNTTSEKKVVFGAYQQPQRNSNSLTRMDAKQAEKRLLALEQAMDAAGKGNVKLLEQLLHDNSSRNDISVTSRDDNGATLVHHAAQGGHFDCLSFLLEEVSTDDVTSMVDVDDRTPAMAAIENGHEDCLRLLLKVSGGEMETDDHSRTLLHFAAYHGQTKCLQFLLQEVKKNGADLNEICDDSGVTPAHVAAQQGHLNCLYLLIENNVDVLQGDNDDLTPADWAAKANQQLCQQYLSMVAACWTAKEELEQTQEKLERAVKENSSMRSQLSELKIRHDDLEREVQRLREDCEKRVKENRQDVVSMMACFVRQLHQSSELHSDAAVLSKLVSTPKPTSGNTESKVEKWRSLSLPRQGIVPPSLPSSLLRFQSLHQFQDETDDSSGEESESEPSSVFSDKASADLGIRKLCSSSLPSSSEQKKESKAEQVPQSDQIHTDV